jgi:hypothetical protein
VSCDAFLQDVSCDAVPAELTDMLRGENMSMSSESSPASRKEREGESEWERRWEKEREGEQD